MQLTRELKCAAIGGGVALFGMLFGWAIFPAVLKSQLKKEMALSKKTDVRQMWEKIPFPLDFKIYLFNYTNPEEVHKGGIPIVNEIGPYYFEEWKEKVEIQDHEEDDSITYRNKDVFYFKPELSKGLTGEEIIVMPHLFLMGMIVTVAVDKPAMLKVADKAINGIFDDPPDVFMRVKAMDVMFRGIIINCNRTAFAPKAACTTIKKEVTGIVFEPNNQFRLSLFGMRNATVSSHVVKVKRGMKNVMDVGMVVAIDGKPKMDIWNDSCNEYQGTDGTIFPPFLTKNDRLQSYSGDLCRSFKAWFQKKTSYKGIKTNRYIANIGDFANDPELQCFCETIDSCPPKGLMNLKKCSHGPFYASSPHYLDADPQILANVKGLNPDINEHGIEIDFEPISGTPLVAKQRVQINIQLYRVDKIGVAKTLPHTIAPLFWIEEGLALNKTFIKMMKKQLFIPKKAVSVLTWMMVIFGTLSAIGCVAYYHKGGKFGRPNRESSVTKIKPEVEQKEISVIGDQAQDQEPAKVM